MADGLFAGKRVEVALAENLGDQSHFRVNVNTLAVGSGNPGALLAAMLEREESEEGEAAGLPTRRIYRYNAALFIRVVERAVEPGRLKLAIHGFILCFPSLKVNRAYTRWWTVGSHLGLAPLVVWTFRP